MTFEEYVLRLRGARLRELDQKFTAYSASWMQRAVQAVEKDGRTYQFKDLDEIFNYEKSERILRGEDVNAEQNQRKQELISERDRYRDYILKLKADKAKEGIKVTKEWLNERGLSDVE